MIGKKKRVLEIGSLDKKITLQLRAIVAEGEADYTHTFTNPITVWACIDTSTGKEFFDDINQETKNITHTFYIRYRSDVTSDIWIDWLDRKFKIVSIENMDERNRFLKLYCSERGNAQFKASFQ